MSRKLGAFYILLGVALILSLSDCGKKGPPFLPRGDMSFFVTQLKGEWEDGAVVLTGRVQVLRGRKAEISDVIGCRVFHVRYAFDHAPCESCPIDYPDHRDIKGEVIVGEKFYCVVPMKNQVGVHYFEVRLIGRKGAIGPLSDRLKVEYLESHASFSL
ncbi:MAG: lipoprotein [Thermodesulfobacteriota bacterium]|nr:lipoprotein [Thermodesulfobacteriota bacterium]